MSDSDLLYLPTSMSAMKTSISSTFSSRNGNNIINHNPNHNSGRLDNDILSTISTISTTTNNNNRNATWGNNNNNNNNNNTIVDSKKNYNRFLQ